MKAKLPVHMSYFCSKKCWRVAWPMVRSLCRTALIYSSCHVSQHKQLHTRAPQITGAAATVAAAASGMRNSPKSAFRSIAQETKEWNVRVALCSSRTQLRLTRHVGAMSSAMRMRRRFRASGPIRRRSSTRNSRRRPTTTGSKSRAIGERAQIAFNSASSASIRCFVQHLCSVG